MSYRMQYCRNALRKHGELLRKAIHLILAFSFVVLVEVCTQMELLLVCTAVLVAFVIFRNTYFTNYLHSPSRTSYGEFFFVFGVVGSLLLSGGVTHFFQLAMVVLALADPFASLFGRHFGTHEYSVRGEVRTYEGSAVCCVIATGVFLMFGYTFVVATTAGVLLALLEAFSIRGSDNFFLPVATVLLAFLLG